MVRTIGITFSETLTGTYQLICDRPDNRESRDGRSRHRLIFRIDASSSDLWKTLRDGRVVAAGYIEAEGLVKHSRITGYMIIKPLFARYIYYQFEFTGDDGNRYCYSGQKDIRHTHPIRTWKTLPGTICDSAGNKIAQSMVFFEPKELAPFLRSFRPTLTK